MVKRTGLRQVPWQSWAHWVSVGDEIFSGCNDRISSAQNRIKAWQGRGNVPISVETTSALTRIQQRDPYFNHEVSPGDGLPDDMLQMMYAMAIQRLVNGVVDVSAKRNSSSVATRADSAGLPRLLVDIRHETAHTELPGLPLLRSASKQALEWLKAHYWDPQRQALGKVREELKKVVLKHCHLVMDILTPIPKPVDEEINKDVDGEREHRMLKAMRTMRNIHKRNLKAMKQERVKLFQDLEERCLTSTSELVSILVDDALLEQGVLPGHEGRDNTQVERDDSDAGSFDLAAATYTAWRYTICRLSNQLPRLPAMLLVAIVERIGSCRPERLVSAYEADSSKEKGNGLSTSAGVNRLIAWSAWLLGSEDSEATFASVSQEAVKSKTLGIGRKLSVKADLSEELCRELLRSCLHLSSERGPLAELVSMIALKVGTKKLQHHALMLARLGIIVQAASDPNREIGGNIERSVVLGSGPSLKQASTHGPPGGGEALESSTSCPNPSRKSEAMMKTTTSVLHDSSYERVKKQHQELFARAALKGNVASRSCVRADGGDEDSRTATEGADKSLLRGRSTPAPQGRKWAVAENWRPCALGMIPSPYSIIGILPSLDLHETAGAGANLSEGEAIGGESHCTKQQVYIVEDTGNDRVTGTAEVNANLAKRKCVVEPRPSSPTGEKRAKKAGRHVHFCVADEKTGKPSESLPSKQMTASRIQEQLSGGSLLEGCLRQRGNFLQVSAQRLQSLKAAIHVL